MTFPQLVLIENNSCEEIIAENTLDNLSNPQEYLIEAIKKLRGNGIIRLSGNDIVEISKNIITGTMTIDAANQVLYATGRKSINNMFKLIAILEQAGLKIIDKRLFGVQYFIRGQKTND